jgi:3'-5' exoribonuclease 1
MTSESTRYSHALYLDLEWTCWDAPPPLGMKQEIIEIGIVEMDMSNLEIVEEASYFVRPKRWEISAKCTQITGITTEDIRKARLLTEVLPIITEKFRPASKPCCTWGGDLPVIDKTCASLGLASPFGRPIELCSIFQGVFALKEQPSLRGAIHMLDLEFDGVPHGALPDAKNTARLHASILRRMRGESDPAPDRSIRRDDVPSLSPFAQKLSDSLKRY